MTSRPMRRRHTASPRDVYVSSPVLLRAFSEFTAISVHRSSEQVHRTTPSPPRLFKRVLLPGCTPYGFFAYVAWKVLLRATPRP